MKAEVTLTLKLQRLPAEAAAEIAETLRESSKEAYSEALEVLWLSIPEDRIDVSVSVQPDGCPIGEFDG